MSHFGNLTQTDIDVVRRKLAHWSFLRPQDVEEVLSESLYALAKRLETETIRIPQAWLLNAAKLNARNHRRRRARQQILVESTTASAVAAAVENPAADAAIVHAAIKFAMRDLPIAHQQVIELCDFDQLTVTAAARELGVCRSTAKSWRDRAFDKMRRNSQLSALLEEISE